MREPCSFCGVFLVPEQANWSEPERCKWCASIHAKVGKESTAAECYERARWDRFMARRLEHKVKVDGLLGYKHAVEAHWNAAAAYQKRGDELRTTDPKYVMFVEGMWCLNMPSINVEKEWYSTGVDPTPWPEGWYHVDETMTELYGPFESDVQAARGMQRYAASLEKPETD